MQKIAGSIAALALGALIVTGTPSFAGPKEGGSHSGAGVHKKGRRGGGAMMFLFKDLNLTEAQKARIKPILENAGAQRRALYQNTSLTREQKMARMRNIQVSTMGRINPILTSAQRTKLEASKKQFEQRMKQKGQQR